MEWQSRLAWVSSKNLIYLSYLNASIYIGNTYFLQYVAEVALESSKSKDGDDDDDGSPQLSPDDGVGEYQSDESDSDLVSSYFVRN